MKYFDTFTGYGGFSIGIQRAFGTISRQPLFNESSPERNLSEFNGKPKRRTEKPLCIGFSEVNKYAIQVYQKHFPGHKNYGDITKINPAELPDFDLLTGGFPCQAFSIAGKRQGFNDTRGTLFFDIARILKEKRPRNFILENVKGLLSHDNGRTFKTIITTLVELGYCVEWQVLNAKDFGVPQNRERVFIVGHFGGVPERKVFPIGGTNKKDNVISKEKRFAITDSGLHRTKQLRSNILPPLRAGRGADRADMISIVENAKIRRLTPLECERLMGLPDNWTKFGKENGKSCLNCAINRQVGSKQIGCSACTFEVSDTQRYKLCGNGVVVNVVEEVVRKLYNLK